MFTHNCVFCLQRSHNPLFKDLKLLKLHDVLESEIITFFCKSSRNELAKSVCSKSNLVYKVHTRNACNNLLIFILPLDMAITLCAVMVLLYGINSLKIFFQTMIEPFLKLKSFLQSF